MKFDEGFEVQVIFIFSLNQSVRYLNSTEYIQCGFIAIQTRHSL